VLCSCYPPFSEHSSTGKGKGATGGKKYSAVRGGQLENHSLQKWKMPSHMGAGLRTTSGWGRRWGKTEPFCRGDGGGVGNVQKLPRLSLFFCILLTVGKITGRVVLLLLLWGVIFFGLALPCPVGMG